MENEFQFPKIKFPLLGIMAVVSFLALLGILCHKITYTNDTLLSLRQCNADSVELFSVDIQIARLLRDNEFQSLYILQGGYRFPISIQNVQSIPLSEDSIIVKCSLPNGFITDSTSTLVVQNTLLNYLSKNLFNTVSK